MKEGDKIVPWDASRRQLLHDFAKNKLQIFILSVWTKGAAWRLGCCSALALLRQWR